MPTHSPDGDPSLVRLERIRKAFGDHEVLRGIDLEIPAGARVAIIGPSGSGKSTLLRTMNLLEVPTSGHLYFEGVDITDVRSDIRAVRRQIGFVFQHFNLFPNKTALGNVTLGLRKVLGVSRAEAEERAMAELRRVGLAEKANARPGQLSGGQRQRVAIARALALRPKVMLLDEITSALDPELVQEVLAAVRQLAQEGMTLVIVTHEIRFARDVATEVVFMDHGQIIESGPPAAVLGAPSDPRCQTFLSAVLH
jgi:ABC-type polar amino acid transport system ATPase subunit